MKHSAKSHPADTERAERTALAAEVAANPYLHLSAEKIGILFGFGRNTMTAILGLEPPMTSRKINPARLLEWLQKDEPEIRKIRDGKDDE